MIRRALEMNVNCLVLCQTELSEELRALPTETCIISTPYDPFRAARLLFLSVSIGSICRTEDLVCFHLADRVDEVKEKVLQFRESCYPILDENEKVVGVLTRYHLLRPRRKRVVLVDHNEISQSVPGLEEADILEIIDHHRLADIQTANPIYVRNEPVGSTNTIIASMFQDRGLMPSPKMAGMMAAAIISDTVMFKSPTCTERDKRTAERMARIANVSLDELGREIFSASVGNKSADELIRADYKEFHIAGHDLAVSQITCVDSPEMLERKEEFLEVMANIAKEKDFTMVVLMLTDVLLEGTQLIYLGDHDTICQAFNVQPKDNTVFLPGIMSRKKQVIPMLSALWG
jgi:manganese-dependent inorganic pyrophosphatase